MLSKLKFIVQFLKKWLLFLARFASAETELISWTSEKATGSHFGEGVGRLIFRRINRPRFGVEEAFENRLKTVLKGR
jgi:hypothetical protein